MATNVGKSKTKETELSVGAVFFKNEKEKIKYNEEGIITSDDVRNNPFLFSTVNTHECIFNEAEKVAHRILIDENGNKKEIKVKPESLEKFKKAAEAQTQKPKPKQYDSER